MKRRRFVQGLAAGAAVTTFAPWLSSEARAAKATTGSYGIPELSGNSFDLSIEPTAVNVTGTPAIATLVNGLQPGPLLRWREGDTVTLRVTNHLNTSTSLHWHGILLPSGMDGVPGISYPGIAPGGTFVYRFPVRQSGTYWYHSHTRFQEQSGANGPLVIEPRGQDPVQADRDYVLMFTDWTDENPDTVYANIRKMSDYYNYHERTLGDFFSDIQKKGLADTLQNRLMWGEMRMSPRDIADVTGDTYTYLVNGQPPAANFTALFRPGERVRLRFINGSAMTYFDVRIPGLKMTVVATDGNNIEPVSVDEFRMGVAETYDVVVEPQSDEAYTVFAQSLNRSGYARATLAPCAGMQAAVPTMDPIFNRTMVDMGMGRMSMDGMRGMDMSASSATSAVTTKPAPPNASGQTAYPQPRQVHIALGPEVANVAMEPTERFDEPGDGLNGNGRRVLTYADLVRLDHGPQNRNFDTREPDAEVLLHLTGNMQRFIFGFNGKTYDQGHPVRLPYGQRIRVTLINDTVMEHPLHLHGMWSELENHHGRLRPLKHTLNVKPGEKLHYYVNADARGLWAYHCHLLYHMAAGMFTTAVVA